MTLRRTMPLTAAVALLAGCANHTPIDPDFGNAVRLNEAAQAATPLPAQRGPVEANGRRAADAVGRYESGTVRQPRTAADAGLGLPTGGGGR